MRRVCKINNQVRLVIKTCIWVAVLEIEASVAQAVQTYPFLSLTSCNQNPMIFLMRGKYQMNYWIDMRACFVSGQGGWLFASKTGETMEQSADPILPLKSPQQQMLKYHLVSLN